MAKPNFQLIWGETAPSVPIPAPSYAAGWDAYLGSTPPLGSDHDYVMNQHDIKLAYLNQQGIAEWDALTAYDTDAYVKGSDGELYRSTATTTGNDPTLGGPWSLAILPVATPSEAQSFTAGKLIDGEQLDNALKGANQSLATSGFQALPGGLIIQWGTADASGPKPFPITFPNVCFAGVATDIGVLTMTQISFSIVSNSQYEIKSDAAAGSASNAYWIAIGH